MSTLFAISAIVIPKAHTIIAGLAFSTALLMGWASGIWKELCENAVSGHEDASKCNLGHAYQSMPFYCITRYLLLRSTFFASIFLKVYDTVWPEEWFPSVSAT